MSVVITIPVYREQLTITEKAALQQLRRVLGHYPCVFVAPESLDFDYEGLADGVPVERFADHWFTSITNYSRLLLNEQYYARFAAYDYMLIYQLDAFVFADRLHEFCQLGYDYIGAPIAPDNPIWHAIGARVGNGGLSLRKIATARQALRQWEKLPPKRQQIFQDVFLRVEDSFWGWCGAQQDFDFRCAPVSVAVQFSIQEDVQRCYRRLADGQLNLFGCHGWDRTNVAFWRQWIGALGYDLSSWDCEPGSSRRQEALVTYWQKRRYIDVVRLWGALRQHKYTAMTIMLMNWLECYPSGDKIWAGLGEELQYLWRRCRQEGLSQEAAQIELERLEQALDEALCRTLQAGSWQTQLPWLLESLLPQIRQRKTLAAAELCKLVDNIRWQEWQDKAVYGKPAAASVKKQHIVAISMVKNEMDIIESFVRHTLSFADELLIIDHQSSDKTRPILEALQQEGLPLTIHTAHRVEYAQAEMTTGLMYEAINDHGADIIIPLDADEFLVGTAPGKSVREYLEELDAGEIYILPWRCHIPYQPEAHREEFLLARPVLGRVHYNDGHKSIIGARRVTEQALKLIQGNHYLYYEQDGKKIPAAMQPCRTLELAHFYWRSQEQYQTKIAVGWPNIAARYSIAAVGGGGYRDYHRRMLQGETISPLEFLEQGALRDLRPLVEPQTLRYSHQVVPDPQKNLMEASVLLAERVAEQRMLTKKVLVTTVVPYMGNSADFAERLQQTAVQDYPFRQVLIPCIAQPVAVERQQLIENCRLILGGKCAWQVLETEEGQDVFSQLAAVTKGDFIHWHLPGTTVAENFLTRMVTGMVEQYISFAMLIGDGREDYRNELPYITIHPLENTQVAKAADFWHRLLEIGKYPAGDLTASLISREIMDSCGWLRGAFLLPEAEILPFTAWKVLLSAAAQEFVGLISDCYAWPRDTDLPLERLVMHQLEWWELLCMEKDNWKAEDWRETVRLLLQNGERILQQALAAGIATDVPLWQHYQQVLLTI